jgi:hypothetical protein
MKTKILFMVLVLLVARPALAQVEWVEAETGGLAGSMMVVENYITAAEREDGTALFMVVLPQAGSYVIQTRIWAGGSGADSFHVSVDDLGEDVYDTNPKGDPAKYNAWIDDVVRVRAGGTWDSPTLDPVVLELVAGQHTIIFRAREPGTRLDKFKFTLASDLILTAPKGFSVDAQKAEGP